MTFLTRSQPFYLVHCLFILALFSFELNAETKTQTETRKIEAFSRVIVDGPFTIDWTPGKETSITITAPSDEFEKVKVTQKGESLFLDFHIEKSKLPDFTEKWKWGNQKSKENQIHLVSPSLQSILFEGYGSGKFVGKSLSGETFEAIIKGTGNFDLEGTIGFLKTEIKGAGNIDASHLKAQDVEAVVSGAGNISVNADRKIDAKILGAGNIEYGGSPAVTKEILGAGAIFSQSNPEPSKKMRRVINSSSAFPSIHQKENSDVGAIFIATLGILSGLLICALPFGVVGFIFYLWFKHRTEKLKTIQPLHAIPLESKAFYHRKKGTLLTYLGVGISLFTGFLFGGWFWGSIPFFWGLALLHIAKYQESNLKNEKLNAELKNFKE